MSISTKFGQITANCVQISTKCGQGRATLAAFGPTPVEHSQIWPKVCQFRTKLDRAREHLAESGQNLAELAQIWPNLGKICSQRSSETDTSRLTPKAARCHATPPLRRETTKRAVTMGCMRVNRNDDDDEPYSGTALVSIVLLPHGARRPLGASQTHTPAGSPRMAWRTDCRYSLPFGASPFFPCGVAHCMDIPPNLRPLLRPRGSPCHCIPPTPN